MLHDDDLEAAVGAGIVTQPQADALREFAAKRRSIGAAEHADEEDFRFMRGFSDIFFAIGVVLFGAGLAIFAGFNASPLVYGLSAVIMWGLAELLVRRKRLVLPGIFIVAFFIVFAVLAIPIASWVVSTPTSSMAVTPTTNLLLGLFGNGTAPRLAINATLASVAAGVFYLRFRFPFALLPFAAGAASAIIFTIDYFLFNGSAAAQLWLMLLCGAGVFAFAMWFDLSDRLRVTRRSDCAFWLHILAAPLIVHALVGLVSFDRFKPDHSVSAMIIGVAALLTVVALIIDRRALLVSALIYVGSVIAYVLSTAVEGGLFVSIATLVILGILVLALGIGWAALRRRVLPLLPPHFVDRLPPAVPA